MGVCVILHMGAFVLFRGEMESIWEKGYCTIILCTVYKLPTLCLWGWFGQGHRLATTKPFWLQKFMHSVKNNITDVLLTTLWGSKTSNSTVKPSHHLLKGPVKFNRQITVQFKERDTCVLPVLLIVPEQTKYLFVCNTGNYVHVWQTSINVKRGCRIDWDVLTLSSYRRSFFWS